MKFIPSFLLHRGWWMVGSAPERNADVSLKQISQILKKKKANISMIPNSIVEAL